VSSLRYELGFHITEDGIHLSAVELHSLHIIRDVFSCVCVPQDRLCGLVVRLPGCRPRGPGFDPWRYQIF
jgi:hypothetical protein